MESSKNKQPFHSGEIYHFWSYLQETKEYLVTIQVLRNHAEDDDLKLLLDDIKENSFQEEEQQIETIIKEAGIRLPPSPPDRPNVELQDIPAGARFQDAEITSLIQKELISGMQKCSSMIGIANQEDIKDLFEDFHAIKAENEWKLVKLSKDKGWYVSPPINIK